MANQYVGRLTDEEVFVENSTYARHHIKQRLLKYVAYECKECGQGLEWNGKPLTLQLEHINGVRDDNRIDNLCFLCPNCHTQTSTYAKRNYSNENRKKKAYKDKNGIIRNT